MEFVIMAGPAEILHDHVSMQKPEWLAPDLPEVEKKRTV